MTTNLSSSIFIVTGTAKPSEKSTLSAYRKHIKKGSTIVHDKENLITYWLIILTLLVKLIQVHN